MLVSLVLCCWYPGHWREDDDSGNQQIASFFWLRITRGNHGETSEKQAKWLIFRTWPHSQLQETDSDAGLASNSKAISFSRMWTFSLLLGGLAVTRLNELLDKVKESLIHLSFSCCLRAPQVRRDQSGMPILGTECDRPAGGWLVPPWCGVGDACYFDLRLDLGGRGILILHRMTYREESITMPLLRQRQ